MRLLPFVLCFSLLTPVYAKDKPTTLPAWLYKRLGETEKFIANESYGQAEKGLKEVLAKVEQGSYGHAITLRSLASVYALNNQYKQAAARLSECLGLNILPEKESQQAVLNLGQLYMAREQYSKAVKTLEPWLANHPETADSNINALVANAYTQLKRYQKALPYIKKAIRQSKKPNGSWYELNLALYYQLEKYPAAATLLQKLIYRHPDKKEYWDQLSAVYQQTKNYKKALSTLQLAYTKGIMSSEKEILALANLFLYTEAPYKAAQLMDKEIKKNRIKNNSKNWEMLASAWQMAKEFDRAVSALESASKLDDRGRLYQKLGSIHVSQENWSKAVKSLNKAINKGGLKDKASVYVLLGMSYFEMNKLESAKKFFLKAQQYSKTKKSAGQWLAYIKSSQS